MSTKITLIYDNPGDPNAFEAGYPDVVAAVRAIPGLERIEASKVWPMEDGSQTPAYRLLDLYFADYEAAPRTVATAEAGAFIPAALALATGVRIAFADVEQS